MNVKKLSMQDLRNKMYYYEKAIDLALDFDTMWEMYDKFFECSIELQRRLRNRVKKIG